MGFGLGIGVTVGIFALLSLVFVGLYNGLVQARNQVDNGWSQIDVQLKRLIAVPTNTVTRIVKRTTGRRTSLPEPTKRPKRSSKAEVRLESASAS